MILDYRFLPVGLPLTYLRTYDVTHLRILKYSKKKLMVFNIAQIRFIVYF